MASPRYHYEFQPSGRAYSSTNTVPAHITDNDAARPLVTGSGGKFRALPGNGGFHNIAPRTGVTSRATPDILAVLHDNDSHAV